MCRLLTQCSLDCVNQCDWSHTIEKSLIESSEKLLPGGSVFAERDLHLISARDSFDLSRGGIIATGEKSADWGQRSGEKSRKIDNLALD